MIVEVRNNNVDRALKILKRKLMEDGLFKEVQKRKFYEKPSDKKRRKRREAITRLKNSKERDYNE